MTYSTNDLIAKRVRFHRNDLGLSRRVLSGLTGISERYLAQMEAGKANVSVLLLEKIAHALDLRLTDLVKQSNERPINKELAMALSKLDHEGQKQVLSFVKNLRKRPNKGAKSIALIGMRGAGKSTLGKQLARVAGLPFVRLSDRVVENSGMSVEELMADGGAAAYREQEHKALLELTACSRPKVLEVSGGIVDSPETYQLLLEHFHTVYLKAQPAEHVKRVADQDDFRPMANDNEPVKTASKIVSARDPMYKKADLVVDTSGDDEAESFARLKAAIEKMTHLH